MPSPSPHAPLHCPDGYTARYPGRPDDVAGFFGMVTNIDDNLGRLLGKLAAWGIERDTIVVFLTDNGGTVGTKVFNAGMRGQKGAPYRGGTRGVAFVRPTCRPNTRGWCGELTAAYARWGAEVRPGLVNEDAYKTAPAENPFRALYRRQFGG